jgi:hypothetical protein
MRNSHGDPETIDRPAPGSKTQKTSYTYTTHGQVESLTNTLSKVWKYEHDTAGDLTAEIDTPIPTRAKRWSATT